MKNKFIGRGTFGEVYIIDGFVYKICNLFRPDNILGRWDEDEEEQSPDEKDVPDINIIDNVLREAVFYAYIRSAHTHNNDNLTTQVFKSPPPSIPVDVRIWIEKQKIIMGMPYAGLTLSVLSPQSKLKTGKLFAQLLEALVWMHARGMSHGDLKPSNILVDVQNNKLTLIDYGSIFFATHIKLTYQRCTLFYVSPEELIHNIVGPPADVWAFGAILFEHLTNGCVFLLHLLKYMKINSNVIELFQQYSNCLSDTFNSRSFLKHFYSDLHYGSILSFLYKHIKDRDMLSVLCRCFILDPKERITSYKLYTDEQLFAEYLKEHGVPDVQTPSQLLQNIPASPIDKLENIEERVKIIIKVFQLLNHDQSQLGHQLFMHSLMLFDRAVLRYEALYNHEPPAIVHGLYLLFAVGISAMILKGSFVSLQMIQNFIVANVTLKQIAQELISFIHILDFKLFNLAPDILCEQLQDIYTESQVFRKVYDVAVQYSWTHSTISSVMNKLTALE